MKKAIKIAIGGIALLASGQLMAANATGTVDSIVATNSDVSDVYILVNVGGTYAFYDGNNSAIGSILSDALNSGKVLNIWGDDTSEFAGVTIYR